MSFVGIVFRIDLSDLTFKHIACFGMRYVVYLDSFVWKWF